MESFVTSVGFKSLYKVSLQDSIGGLLLTRLLGAYVRYLIGNDDAGAPIYRVCEIVGRLTYPLQFHSI